MELMRFEVRKIGSKKWYGIFNNPWRNYYEEGKYWDLSSKLKPAREFVATVPKEWRFYFTKDGYNEHYELVSLMVECYIKRNCEFRVVEVKNTDKLKKRKCRVLDQHQAVIWLPPK